MEPTGTRLRKGKQLSPLWVSPQLGQGTADDAQMHRTDHIRLRTGGVQQGAPEQLSGRRPRIGSRGKPQLIEKLDDLAPSVRGRSSRGAFDQDSSPGLTCAYRVRSGVRTAPRQLPGEGGGQPGVVADAVVRLGPLGSRRILPRRPAPTVDGRTFSGDKLPFYQPVEVLSHGVDMES